MKRGVDIIVRDVQPLSFTHIILPVFELTPRPPLLRREGEQKPPSLCKRRGVGDEFKKVVHGVIVSLLLVLVICAPGYAQSTEPVNKQVETLYQQATEYFNAGEYQQAIAVYTNVIELDTTHVNAYWGRGFAYSSLGKNEFAITDFRKVIELQPDFSDAYGMLGWSLMMQGKLEEAKEPFRKAYELTPYYSVWAVYLGHTYLLIGDAATARIYYERALPWFNSEEDFKAGPVANFESFIQNGWQVEACRQELAWMTREFETIYREMITYRAEAEKLFKEGRYMEAAQLYENILELEKTSSTPQIANLSLTLSKAGYCYFQLSQYDKALAYYEQALEFDRESGDNKGFITHLNNIGSVYWRWGQYDKALEYFEPALELARQLNDNASIALLLNSIGDIYEHRQQYEKALEYFEQGLEIVPETGSEGVISALLTNISEVYSVRGDYDKGLLYAEQALELNRDTIQEAEAVPDLLVNIGFVYVAQGKYAEALEYFEQGVKFARQHNLDTDTSLCLNHIGSIYYTLRQYSEAITHFAESVELLERIRKTATGDVRRDYLATQIYAYQYLTSCYLKTGDFAKAFETIELSRAKLLAERLAGSDEVSIPSLERIQHDLSKDTAVLIYADTGGRGMVQLIVTKDTISASERSVSDFVQSPGDFSQPTSAEETPESRGLNLGQKEKKAPTVSDEKKSKDFATIIGDYRMLLQNPAVSGRGLKMRQEKDGMDNTQETLGKRLYTFLFADVQEQIKEKTHLLIIPDGILNFLPFEALIDDQGKYLAENYQISYAQSLAVWDLVGQRQYAPDRKPLLAFGGAVYDAPKYETEMIENEAQLVYLRKQVDTALSQGNSVGELYARLRGGGWSNLPGTLQEVKAIQQVVGAAKILTGEEVNEAAVKDLSVNGELANYKVLHFATHGDADPRIPELSALVLSLSPGSADVSSAFPSWEGSGVGSSGADETSALPEDGYLRAGEIHQLDIKADFVNLSACETGLGKLYSGEGIVGLTQAFLLAGAKGLSVSLWSVADESTAQFMVALYKLVEEEDLSYAEAITEVKRRFIAGDFGEQWKAPYYWAPFVYYGRN